MAQKITCDECGADISSTGNSIGYRIRLAVEHVPCRGGFVTDMMAYPPIPVGPQHFCGGWCLRSWVTKTVAEPKPR